MIDLSSLNPAQYDAVNADAIPIMVTAGPGSGKTRVITTRIAYFIDQGCEPFRILAVTFTNRAAAEMRSRLRRMIMPEQAAQIWIGTFHGLCAQMLRRQGRIVGVPRQFSILATDEQLQVTNRILKEVGPGDVSARQALNIISNLKCARAVGEQRQPADWVETMLETYQRQLVESQALDFDDLLIKGLELLTSDADNPFQHQFEHVLVDEFQDTSRLQYLLAQAWSREHRSLTVVGDPDQSIYSWRSADPRNLGWFIEDYPEAEQIPLNNNYRSTPEVVAIANKVIEPHPDRNGRTIAALRASGDRPTTYQGYSESDEATWIIDSAIRYLADGVSPSEIAILYRTNAQSRSIEEACIQRKLPYRLIGAARFYDRREIRDLVAYLRTLYNPNDSISMRRVVNVPARGIGAASIKQLEQRAHELNASLWAAIAQPPNIASRAAMRLNAFHGMLNRLIEDARLLPPHRLIRKIIDETNYREWITRQSTNEFEAEARIENLEELENIAAAYQYDQPIDALTKLLEDIALYASSEQPSRSDTGSVTLTTLHQAKGLEYPIVFIAGVEEGLIPHARSQHDPMSLNEERRLFYVGVTRAMDILHITHSSRRAVQGVSRSCSPSRFLDDIPEHVLQPV